MNKAKEFFKLAYGGSKNAMSDKILKYGLINSGLAYEISSGLGLEQNITYAVSFVKAEANEIKGENTLFRTFNSLIDAKQYIKELKTTEKEKNKVLELETYEKPIIEELKKLLVEKKVYCVLKKVSASGMYRHIDFFVIVENTPISINRDIIKLGLATEKKESCGVSGCGMDMGFSVVSNLSQKLFNDYKIIKHEWI